MVAHDMGDRPERDVTRDLWLSDNGIRVLRIPARDVLKELEAVVGQIVAACDPSTTTLCAAVPLPFREEFE